MTENNSAPSFCNIKKNFNSIQENLITRNILLTPGEKISINSQVFSINLYSEDQNNVTASDLTTEVIESKDHLFAIDHLLHADECREILRKEETNDFESISSEYPEEYRNSKRIIYNDKELSQRLWQRLKKFLVDCNFMKPYGLDTDGHWIPIGVNECMRLSKYEAGNYFKPHTDAQFLRNDNERSVYTLLIYLNEDFKGGETQFLHRVDSSEEYTTNFKQICEIKPRMGCASVFNHELYHQGCKVMEGVKYILRTEIMFKRIDSTEQPVNKKNDILYNQVMDLMNTSDALEKKGDLKESTFYYRKAQELLMQYGHSTSLLLVPTFSKSTISSTYSLNSSISQLPDELLIHIFKYLKDWEICQLIIPLDRYFNYIGRNQQLWEWMYMKQWGNSITQLLKQFHSRNVEEQRQYNSQDNTSSLEETPTEQQDWFHIYIMKRYFEKEFEPVFIDYGSNICTNTYFTSIDGPVQNTLTRVLRPPASHYSLPKFCSFGLFGDQIDRGRTILIFESGTGIKKYIQIFTYLLYKKLNKTCQRNPLLISLNSKCTADFENAKETILSFLFRIRIPAVCILPRCYLLSIYYNLPTCIVVDIDLYDIHVHTIIQHDKDRIGTIHSDFDFEYIDFAFYQRFEEAQSPEEKIKCIENCSIVKSMNQLLDQHPKELASELLDNIIFSGSVIEMETLRDPAMKVRTQILNMFSSSYSNYKVKYQTSGEEAIQGGINFSKLPNFKDYCSFWFDCEKIINLDDSFL